MIKPARKSVAIPSNVKNILLSLLGCIITAFSIDCILRPNDLTTSGVTGISIIIEKLTHINYSYINMALTIVVLLITLFTIGKKQVFKILLVSIIYSLILMGFQQIDIKIVTSDKLLAVIYNAVTYGVGVGIVLRCGFSFGGTDTVALVLHKTLFKFTKVSNILLILDAVIIAISAFIFGLETAMYSLVNHIVAIQVINFMLYKIGTKLYRVQIITSQITPLSDYIMNTLGRGITLHKVLGGYTNEEKVQMVTVCSPNEMLKIRNKVATLDCKAFIEVTPVLAVHAEGRRFSSLTKELEK